MRTTMTKVFRFYFPSQPDEDQDKFMKNLWNQGTMSYLIFARKGVHIFLSHVTAPILVPFFNLGY